MINHIVFKDLEKTKKIKILQIAADPIVHAKLLMPLIKALEENAFEVDLCCGKGEYLGFLLENNCKVHEVPFSRTLLTYKHILTLMELFKLLKKEKYDIVHVHTPIAAAIGRIAAKLAGVPIIIYTAHGFYFHDNMSFILYKTFLMIEKLLARLTTDWLFLQNIEDECIAKRYKFLKKENRIVWIGNGVSSSEFSQVINAKAWRAENGINENDIVLCFIGRIIKEKGILELIKAFSRIKLNCDNVKLVIVGGTLNSDRDNATARKALRIIRKQNLMNDILFLGYRDDVPQILSAIDIFVLPSYREGMPRSIIEAMMSGKPVIASNIRGCREEIVNGETGILIEPRNVNELENAIRKFISSPEVMKIMGENGRNRARKLYDETAVIERQMIAFRAIIKEIVNG